MRPSPIPPSAAALQQGRYTVVLPDGGHRTLEVTPAGPQFRAGPLIVSYLCGPDNQRDYRAFAHITASGAARIWRRFHGEGALAAALGALVGGTEAQGGGWRRALRCARCRRPLTRPDSIERGMGARCARQHETATAAADSISAANVGSDAPVPAAAVTGAGAVPAPRPARPPRRPPAARGQRDGSAPPTTRSPVPAAVGPGSQETP